MKSITLQQVAAFLNDATLIMTSNGTLAIHSGEEDAIITIDTTSGTVLLTSI
jgi:hypothetical protein